MTKDVGPHPEAHQPQPLAVPTPPGSQLCSTASTWAALPAMKSCHWSIEPGPERLSGRQEHLAYGLKF